MESKGGSGVGLQKGSGVGLQKGMTSTAGSFGSIGLGGSSVQINQNPSSHKVVVQERKSLTTHSVKYNAALIQYLYHRKSVREFKKPSI